MIDTDGSRRRFKLDIVSLRDGELQNIGTWNPDDGFEDLITSYELKMQHFRVLITLV